MIFGSRYKSDAAAAKVNSILVKAYGCSWSTDDPFEIELAALRMGGRWETRRGPCGNGQLFHFQQLQNLIAPWKKWDRWSTLILENIIEHRLTVLTGPASSTKTHNAAFYALCKYIINPTNQCVLVSSTDSRSLELRIWGEIKKLWSAARQVSDAVPGRIVESRQMIITDIEDAEATDYRNGIIGVPVIVGGSHIGLSKLVGFKNGNVLLVADELSYMSPAFYDAISNLSKNPGFQCIGIGNPKDRTDVLGRLAEPATNIGGWEGYEPTGKTFFYPTRFPGGIAICLDGRDSPNNETPDGAPPIYPYIIQKSDIQRDVEYYGEESIQVSMMDYGIFPKDAQSRRVITRTMCEQYHAFEEPVWSHDGLTKIFGIDAAYGSVGGDRCVGVELAFGKCNDTLMRLAFAKPPMVIPVSSKSDLMPEDQIVLWVMKYCIDNGIEPSHVALDVTGRGSLIAKFGEIWSTAIVAVEFGGPASDRMVSEKIQVPANKYYLNFMSELWYQTRHLIEADQVRKLPINVMEEGCMRAWDIKKGNRIQVEPKEECKLRMNRSPDLYDAFAVGVECARRLGLVIRNNLSAKASAGMPNWLKRMADNQKQLKRKQQLVY